jgi:anti-anti-sigma regulatory factor
MRNRGGECKLLNPSKLMREVLELVGLLKVFSVYQDRDQAVASFHHAA